MTRKINSMAKLFRGLLPVVVDVETSGLHSGTDALLEIAAVTLTLDKDANLVIDQKQAYHVEPFIGARLDKEALAITGIDPFSPLRYAIPEAQALQRIFARIQETCAQTGCHRAVLVGHNAWFDLSFIQAAARRARIANVPFHGFTTIDTASLSAVALGETVLARAVKKARLGFDVAQAHSALYDTVKTAELFCYIHNRWSGLTRYS